MGSSFGRIFRLTTWGESHGPALGVVVEGCPAGVELAVEDIQHQLDRRRVGQSKVTTPRGETDRAQVLSGVFEGFATGAPISLITFNADADSSKYEPLRDVFRPGHADFTYWAKYGHRDHRGGGRSSARETWGRVAAGAIARKILASVGCEVYGFAREIGGIAMESFDREAIEHNIVRCPDPVAAERMVQAILAAKEEQDSLGGVVEVRATGVPPGLGEPTFDKLDALIGQAMLSIPATKGVEIGDGFASSRAAAPRTTTGSRPRTAGSGRPATGPAAPSAASPPARRSWSGWRSSRPPPSRARRRPSTPRSSRGRSPSRAGTTRRWCRGRCRWPRRCWPSSWPTSCC
jgi:chorismate synthase